MVLDIFKRSPRWSTKAALRRQADDLLSQAMQAARDPALYGAGATPDDFSGRFDVLTLIASLVSLRLSDLGEPAAGLNQSFVNAVFKSFDDALREDGVGDLTVPKKMQRLAEAFYGRAAAYRKALEAIETGDSEGRLELVSALHRNVLRSDPSCERFAERLADHCVAIRTTLAQVSLDDLCAGAIIWPSPVDREASV
ncbi:MAG: ubiquinol-cytochrome C chaperone family protein [Caulobacterales bacterium]